MNHCGTTDNLAAIRIVNFINGIFQFHSFLNNTLLIIHQLFRNARKSVHVLRASVNQLIICYNTIWIVCR